MCVEYLSPSHPPTQSSSFYSPFLYMCVYLLLSPGKRAPIFFVSAPPPPSCWTSDLYNGITCRERWMVIPPKNRDSIITSLQLVLAREIQQTASTCLLFLFFRFLNSLSTFLVDSIIIIMIRSVCVCIGLYSRGGCAQQTIDK